MEREQIVNHWKCPFCNNIYHLFNEKDIDEHNSKCKEKQELVEEITKHETRLKKVKIQSTFDHLHINVHINKNKVELGLLLHRKLRKSVAEKEAELQALHRRSWIRAETDGSIKRKTQQCKDCSHPHPKTENKHNHVAKTSGKIRKAKSKNGGHKQ